MNLISLVIFEFYFKDKVPPLTSHEKCISLIPICYPIEDVIGPVIASIIHLADLLLLDILKF